MYFLKTYFRLWYIDSVSDSESTSSGECYENMPAEEGELLKPGQLI